MRKSLGGKKSKHFPHFFAAKESSNYAMIIAVVSNSNEHDFVLSAHKVETDDGTKLFLEREKIILLWTWIVFCSMLFVPLFILLHFVVGIWYSNEIGVLLPSFGFQNFSRKKLSAGF